MGKVFMAVGRAALPRQAAADFDFAYACEGQRRILVHGSKGQLVKRADQNGGNLAQAPLPALRLSLLSQPRCPRS
jgi:hypothetical protein